MQYDVYSLKKIILFIYFWLCWVFAAAWAFSLLVMSRGCFLAAVHGFLNAEASHIAEHGLSGMQSSVVVVCGLSSRGSQALGHRLSS